MDMMIHPSEWGLQIRKQRERDGGNLAAMKRETPAMAF
jgi:hypothetical protein